MNTFGSRERVPIPQTGNESEKQFLRRVGLELQQRLLQSSNPQLKEALKKIGIFKNVTENTPQAYSLELLKRVNEMQISKLKTAFEEIKMLLEKYPSPPSSEIQN